MSVCLLPSQNSREFPSNFLQSFSSNLPLLTSVATAILLSLQPSHVQPLSTLLDACIRCSLLPAITVTPSSFSTSSMCILQP
ncbi:hypothetical protein VIGAN_03167100 [Vigna angularis var. angularis]|uniref:Uncharacterized protein n=1 Tax=Vigna angularis var. angularis TaxID=157739 RepID=A0A0S3RMH7_PHAAN|nr:hypothetical protein VIGAN_03167100 [Vigna angularis var. angularis]